MLGSALAKVMSPWRTVDVSSTVVPDPTGRVVIRFVASQDSNAEITDFSGLSRTTASVTGRNKSTTSSMSMLLPAFSSSEKESATDDSSEKKICTWLGLGFRFS